MGKNCSVFFSKHLFWVVLCAGIATAQDFPLDRFTALRQRFPADENSWTKTQYNDYNQRFASLLVDLVWEYRRPSLPKLQVESRISAPRNPPEWLGQTIRYPVSYAHDISQLGLVLGRDVYNRAWRRLPEPHPLTRNPFSAGRLTEAIDPSINSVSLFVDANMTLILCTPQQGGCAAAQALSVIGMQLFLIAHESGHYILKHGINRDANQELAADAYAFDTLMAIAKSWHTAADPKSNRFYDLVFAASAEAPLWYAYQSGASASPAATKAIKGRIDQIEKLADSLDLDVEQVMPDTYSGWNIQPAKISWDRTPRLLIVGGARVDVSEIQGRTLRLPPSITYLLATDDAGVACEKHYGDEAEVRLTFKPWTNANAAQLNQLEKAKSWCDLIAATADTQLHPRSLQLAQYLNEALHFVHAGVLIDSSLAPTDMRAIAERYRKTDSGLGSWGIP